MKSLKMKFIMIAAFMFVVALSVPAQDIFAPMEAALKTGSAANLSKYLNQTVDVTFDDAQTTFDRKAAESALEEFFKKNPPSGFDIIHTGASKGGLKFAQERDLEVANANAARDALQQATKDQFAKAQMQKGINPTVQDTGASKVDGYGRFRPTPMAFDNLGRPMNQTNAAQAQHAYEPQYQPANANPTAAPQPQQAAPRTTSGGVRFEIR